MTESVYRVTEVIGVSADSWEQAARNAVEMVGESVRDLRIAEIVRQDLINLGFRREDITMKGFSGGNIFTAWSLRGTDGDIAVSIGWCTDIPDPGGEIAAGWSGASGSATRHHLRYGTLYPGFRSVCAWKKPSRVPSRSAETGSPSR